MVVSADIILAQKKQMLIKSQNASVTLEQDKYIRFHKRFLIKLPLSFVSHR